MTNENIPQCVVDGIWKFGDKKVARPRNQTRDLWFRAKRNNENQDKRMLINR